MVTCAEGKKGADPLVFVDGDTLPTNLVLGAGELASSATPYWPPLRSLAALPTLTMPARPTTRTLRWLPTSASSPDPDLTQT
jgi:hypothetical protein